MAQLPFVQVLPAAQHRARCRDLLSRETLDSSLSWAFLHLKQGRVMNF